MENAVKMENSAEDERRAELAQDPIQWRFLILAVLKPRVHLPAV
jgi:hypothetical protein